MTRKRVVIIVLVVAAIAAGAAYAGGWFHRDTALQGSGTVEARDIRVGSKIAGRIDKVLVREGDKVKAGQVLVTFDDREMMATLQQSQAAAQKRHDELVALAAKLNPVQSNFNPPKGLDPFIYFEDGSSLDTTSNILTMSNGKQIDTTTGLEYHDPKSIVSMANGAYLDTKNNILTMSDGTKVDTITGLKITV